MYQTCCAGCWAISYVFCTCTAIGRSTGQSVIHGGTSLSFCAHSGALSIPFCYLLSYELAPTNGPSNHAYWKSSRSSTPEPPNAERVKSKFQGPIMLTILRDFAVLVDSIGP